MMNAIILAAGKSSRFAPFTYEKPKRLFRVKGEILIERQIEQLREAGVEEIIVVVGYMKEKFFYLEQKYPGLRLVVNNEFGKKGNLYTLYKAREFLGNTFICCADHFLRRIHSHTTIRITIVGVVARMKKESSGSSLLLCPMLEL